VHLVGKNKKLPATVHQVESFKIIDITLRFFCLEIVELRSYGIRNLNFIELNHTFSIRDGHI